MFEGQDVDPLFQSWGVSTFIDVINGPATPYEHNNAPRFAQPQGFSYLTAAYRGRMNLAELFEGMAISSSLTPGLGISFFQDPHTATSGYLHLNFPAMINVELGALATKNTEFDRFGLVGGIGYEFHAAPLIVDYSRSRLPSGVKLNTTWVQPVYSIGIRYKRGGRIAELNLKYGEQTEASAAPFIQGRKIRARTIRIMAFYYI